MQQTAEAAPNAASSGPMVAPINVNQNQAVVQSVAPSSQAHNSQTVPAPVQPGQDVNQQTNASSQAPAAAPTPEQWYQQYYQQYGGYDHSQHGYQQYYPYQQSAVQHQQQPSTVHGGQPQLQAYSQAPLQAQMPPQSQSQVQPQPHSQSQPQQPVQPLTGQPQAQVPQGFSQHIAHAQSLNPQTQNQPQNTPQQHAHPSMQPHAQIPSQSSVPHGFPTPQAQIHLMQPQSHVPVASYQQPQPSQVHLQPHLMTQPQPPSQPQQPPHLQHQTHPQIRPSQPNQPTALNVQAQPMHTSATAVTGFQSYPQPQPPALQQAQTGASQQPPVHSQPTSGSVAPGQLHGQIPQQPSMFVPPPSHGLIPSQQASFPSQGQLPSMPPAQQQQFHPQAPHPSHSIQQRPYVQQQAPPGLVPGQFHQQGNLAVQQSVPSQLRPQVPPHVMYPNTQSHLHLQQNVAVVPGVQPQQTHNYVGRPGIPIQGAPGQPMPPFPQTYGGYGSAAQAKPALAQNYVHTVSNQPQMASDNQFGHPGILQRQTDHGSEKTAAGYEAGLPSQSAVEKVANTSRPDTDGPNVLKSEAGISFEQDLKGTSNDQSKQNEPHTSAGAGERTEASAVPLSELKREKEESNTYLSESPANDKSGQLGNKKDLNGDTYNEELESQKGQKALLDSEDENFHSTRTVSPSPVSKTDGYKHANPERSQQASVGAREQLQPYNHEQHMNYYGPSISQHNSSGPPTLQTLPSYGEVPGHQPRPHGPGLPLQQRNPVNPSEQLQPPSVKQPPDVPFGGVPTSSSMSSFGGGSGYFGAPRGPPSAPVDLRDGITGRGPQHGSDSQFASPNFGNPIEAEMMQSQGQTRFDGGHSKVPGTFGRGPFGPPSSGDQSSFRMDGGARVDSSLRPQDERFKTFPGDHLKPFPKEAPWTLDQGELKCPEIHLTVNELFEFSWGLSLLYLS